MDEQTRREQQWDRARLALAVRMIGDWYHSGQSSRGYAKSCQADRVLDALGFRPGACYDPAEDDEVRATAAAYLWRHRRVVAREW